MANDNVNNAINSLLEVSDKNPNALNQFMGNVLFKYFVLIIESLRNESLNDLRELQGIDTTNHIRGKIKGYENLLEVLASLK